MILDQSSKYDDLLLENMELYGLAAVAARKGIPLSALLAVTNYTNNNAHEDWFRNHKDASKNYALLFRNL